MDNETSLINREGHNPSEFQDTMTAKGIMIEPTLMHIKEPNGAGERAGRMMGEKLRAMMAYANLPLDLWPATYLHNITPKGHVSGFGMPKTAAQTLHFWNPKTHPTSTFMAGHMYFSKFIAQTHSTFRACILARGTANASKIPDTSSREEEAKRRSI
jgi:hypothetical protein